MFSDIFIIKTMLFIIIFNYTENNKKLEKMVICKFKLKSLAGLDWNIHFLPYFWTLKAVASYFDSVNIVNIRWKIKIHFWKID